ncbi:MAG: hypothetical protein VYA34_07595 [Myxococcota bacterium]|nr:hypothetical protein [Myxococcota bacterium]
MKKIILVLPVFILGAFYFLHTGSRNEKISVTTLIPTDASGVMVVPILKEMREGMTRLAWSLFRGNSKGRLKEIRGALKMKLGFDILDEASWSDLGIDQTDSMAVFGFGKKPKAFTVVRVVDEVKFREGLRRILKRVDGADKIQQKTHVESELLLEVIGRPFGKELVPVATITVWRGLGIVVWGNSGNLLAEFIEWAIEEEQKKDKVSFFDTYVGMEPEKGSQLHVYGSAGWGGVASGLRGRFGTGKLKQLSSVLMSDRGLKVVGQIPRSAKRKFEISSTELPDWMNSFREKMPPFWVTGNLLHQKTFDELKGLSGWRIWGQPKWEEINGYLGAGILDRALPHLTGWFTSWGEMTSIPEVLIGMQQAPKRWLRAPRGTEFIAMVGLKGVDKFKTILETQMETLKGRGVEVEVEESLINGHMVLCYRVGKESFVQWGLIDDTYYWAWGLGWEKKIHDALSAISDAEKGLTQFWLKGLNGAGQEFHGQIALSDLGERFQEFLGGPGQRGGALKAALLKDLFDLLGHLGQVSLGLSIAPERYRWTLEQRL